MDNKEVTNLTPNSKQWQDAMNAANRALKFVPLLNKKMAKDGLKKIMATANAKLTKEK